MLLKKSLRRFGLLGKGLNLDISMYVENRNRLFEELYHGYIRELELKSKEDITIKLDGDSHLGTSWNTTPNSILELISDKNRHNLLVAKVKYRDSDWKLIDLSQPLENDCELQFLDFKSNEGKATYWHSSSHILGGIIEANYNGYLCHGPAITNGFF